MIRIKAVILRSTLWLAPIEVTRRSGPWQQKKPERTLADFDFAKRRDAMVRNQIAARGITSEPVLEAMRRVPRESFVPPRLREFAYDDCALPIEHGQTISQPYIVALMTEALTLKGGERVLEIGSGSGYGAAVLSRIAGRVFTVERIGELAGEAAARLADLGYTNVEVREGDGTQGWPEHAPYDAIVVTAGGPEIPRSLKTQLRIGGRLVIPIGPHPHDQALKRVTRVSEGDYRTEDLGDVRFVPLVGEEGWSPADAPSKGANIVSFLARAIAGSTDPFIR